MADLKLTVDGKELANAAAQMVVAYERLRGAIDALEKASGINFRETVSAEFHAEQSA